MAETLRQKQSRFARMVADLIIFAYDQGYEVTFGDCYRDERCKYGLGQSLHRKRLAVDLNLFRNGHWLSSTASHQPLGEYWESLGGSWGGRFGDGNHYSLEHGGVK
jgi:hypothetical protein